MITPDEIHPEAWRRSAMHRLRMAKCERTDKIGQIGYQCKRGEHGLKCSKLNCPCECHAAERDAMAEETRK